MNENENRTVDEQKLCRYVWNSMTEEQKARINECKSEDEMLELLKQTGIELDDSVLEEVMGGAASTSQIEKQPPLWVDVALDIATAPVDGPTFMSTILRLLHIK